MHKIKAIIFDFWGTLIENGIYSPVKQVKAILGLKMFFSEYIVKFENAFMTQKFKDLKSAFENVCKAFEIKPEKDKIDQLIGLWNKNMLLAKPFPETIKALDDLKKDYKIVLLSNTDVFSVEPVIEKYGLKKYFDDIFLSYKIGMLKTNPKVFEDITKKLKVKKEEVVMVGDSMQSDIKGAENASVKAVLVDRKNRMEYKNKINNLSELRKFLETKKFHSYRISG